MPSQGPRLTAALCSDSHAGRPVAVRCGIWCPTVSIRIGRRRFYLHAERSRPPLLAGADSYARHRPGNRVGAAARICTDQLKRSARNQSLGRDQYLQRKAGRRDHYANACKVKSLVSLGVYYKVT
jgi:hypothetical protein